MARRSLKTSLSAFLHAIDESRRLAADAHSWASPGAGIRRPMISRQRRDSMTELAFLRAFLAWEMFLEESFVLYLVGLKPPRGRRPKRYAFPPNVRIAAEWVIPEGSWDHAKWTTVDKVCKRAERFFVNGGPFAVILKSNQNTLNESKTIRNAIAHMSANVQTKLETLVRNKLGTLPLNVTVGAFLAMTVPRSTPPQSFLDHYLSKVEFAARRIVPV